MSYFWFVVAVVEFIIICILAKNGAIDKDKSVQVLGEEAKKVEDATSALVQKAKETIKKAKEKP